MILNLVYGYRVATDNDPHVAAIEHAAYLTAKYTLGAVPVDFLPICTNLRLNALHTKVANIS